MVLQEADHQLFTESVYRELEIGLSDGGKDLGKITRILQKNISGEQAQSRSVC